MQTTKTQASHRGLNSDFVVRCFDTCSISTKVDVCIQPRHLLVSVVEQTGLSLTLVQIFTDRVSRDVTHMSRSMIKPTK